MDSLDHWRRLMSVVTLDKADLFVCVPGHLDKVCMSLCLWSGLGSTLRLSNTLSWNKVGRGPASPSTARTDLQCFSTRGARLHRIGNIPRQPHLSLAYPYAWI